MTPDMPSHAVAKTVCDKPKFRVLLVDDDPRDLEYYSVILRTRGCEVVSCASYSEAAARLGSDVLDFVIVNQGGPTFEGRAVLERAIEIDRYMPTLVLTRCVQMKSYIEAIQLGAIDYLEKHVDLAELSRIIENHVRASSRAAELEPSLL